MREFEYFEKLHKCDKHEHPNVIRILGTKYIGEKSEWTMETDCGDGFFDIMETIYFCPYCGTKLSE